MKTIEVHTRALLCLLAAVPLAHAAIAPERKGETPRAVTVHFATGDATFNLLKGVVQSIDFHVSGKLYPVPFIGCSPLEHVRFDTAEFYDDRQLGRKPGSFTLNFQIGTEESRAFGRLPLVQITVLNGRPFIRLVTRPIEHNGGFSTPLCPR